MAERSSVVVSEVWVHTVFTLNMLGGHLHGNIPRYFRLLGQTSLSFLPGRQSRIKSQKLREAAESAPKQFTVPKRDNALYGVFALSDSILSTCSLWSKMRKNDHYLWYLCTLFFYLFVACFIHGICFCDNCQSNYYYFYISVVKFQAACREQNFCQMYAHTMIVRSRVYEVKFMLWSENWTRLVFARS